MTGGSRLLLAVALSGCSTGYAPRDAQAPIILTGESIYTAGRRHRRGLWGDELVELTEPVPRAQRLARSARARQREALAVDMLSALMGIGAFAATLTEEGKANSVTAQVLFNLSLVGAVLGPMLHVQSAALELDAVNVYNDERRLQRRSRRGR